jgi:SAM-dependent methyltransferase
MSGSEHSAQPRDDRFIAKTAESLADSAFVRLTLSSYAGPEKDLTKIIIRPVTIKSQDRLSFIYRYKTKDVTKNYSVAHGMQLIGELLGTDFRSGNLFTTVADAQVEYDATGAGRLRLLPPRLMAAESRSHDREKPKYIEPAGNIYLRELGVTNAAGDVRTGHGDKFRQITKFLEIVASLTAKSPDMTRKRELSILDMGSGKGYLTFALYDYFNNVLKQRTKVTGLEARDDLVKLCNRIASDAGFENLSFVQGYIEDHPREPADILMALHACDTATDEAIYQGIRAHAGIIICAPCCQKEVRPQLVPPRELRYALKFGILKERQSDIVTDALRALYLEVSGYKTNVFEFISLEHTQKNVMIAGIRHNRPIQREALLAEIAALRDGFGIKEQRLGDLLSMNEPSGSRSH